MDRALSFHIEDHLLAVTPHLTFEIREGGEPFVRVEVPLSSEGRDVAISLEAAGVRLRTQLEAHLCRFCREAVPTGDDPHPDLCGPCAAGALRRAARGPGVTCSPPTGVRHPWIHHREPPSTSTAPRR